MIGRTFGHYEVLEKLGEGGMGVVYKARDTRLDRLVAVKVLPPGKADDPDRRRRFVQEAKAASALNHADIVTVHDIDEHDGTWFIVMELVEGRTLGRVLARGPLAVRDALHYAVQIADAIATAHAAGIIHRDLKPSNVMVTAEGAVKVVDFGLAKLVETGRPGDSTASVLAGPAAAVTEAGVVLGTAAYMSPEQAEGQPLDSRSDIFAFGAVLYEMLTGVRAFQGASAASTLAAVLHDNPRPFAELGLALPRELETVVVRCLRKDPRRRWQTMSDLRVALQDLKEDSDSGRLTAPTLPAARRGSGAGLLLLGVAVVAAVALAGWRLLHPNSARPVLELARITFGSGTSLGGAIAPDGRLVVYASDRAAPGQLDLWLQQVGGTRPIQLTRDPADDGMPAFSADGSRIAFRSERDGGGLYAVDALGGPEQKLADEGHHPQYSPDGALLAYLRVGASAGLGRLFVMPAQGGAPRPLAAGHFVVLGSAFFRSFAWSPDGRHLLFDGQKGTDRSTRDWWVVPVDSGEPVATGAPAHLPDGISVSWPCAWFGDEVIFTAGSMLESSDLYAIRIGSAPWRVEGPARRLTGATGAQPSVSVAQDGRLLVTNVQLEIDVWSVALDARGAASGAPAAVVRDSTMKFQPSSSREGAFLAYESVTGSRLKRRTEVHVRNMASGEETVHPGSGRASGLRPRLSADGSLLAYRDLVSDRWESYVVAPGGGRRVACVDCSPIGFAGSPPGLVVRSSRTALSWLDLERGSQRMVLDGPEPIDDADVSPDGRRLAVTTTMSDGPTRLWLAAVQTPPVSPAQWTLLAEDRRLLASPRWSPASDRVYFVSNRDGFSCVWALTLDASGRSAGEAAPVLHSHGRPSLRFMPPSVRTLAVTKDGVFFNASELRASLWTAVLSSE